jgi:microcystin-dependent protein
MTLILPNTIANGTPADGEKLEQNFDTVQSWANTQVVLRDGSTSMTGALLLPGAPTQANQAASKKYVDDTIAAQMAIVLTQVAPIGTIWMTGNTTAPSGWLLCDGTPVSRITYAALFALWGTRFGVGDGSTTFNTPNMTGRSPMGPYPGGPWGQTLGQTLGNATPAIINHAHTMTHTHTGRAPSGGSGHSHNLSVRRSASALGTGEVARGAANSGTVENYATATDGAHEHTLAISPFVGNTAAVTSGDQVTGNIHPSTIVNFMCRAL